MLGILRQGISQTNGSKEPLQLRRQEAHGSSAQRLGALIAQTPAAGAATNAVVALAAGSSQPPSPKDGAEVVTSSRSRHQPSAPEMAETGKEARQWRSRCNRDIEARQERAIQKVVERKSLECARQQQEELKRQWRTHRSKDYLVKNIKDPALKWHLERSSKPRTLPKLPNAASALASAVNAVSAVASAVASTKHDVSSASEEPDAQKCDTSPKASCNEALATSSTSDMTPKASSPGQSCGSASQNLEMCVSESAAQGSAKDEDLTPVQFSKDAESKDGRAPLPHESLAEEEEAAKPDRQVVSEQVEEPEQTEEAEGSKQAESQTRQRGSMQSFLDRQKSSLVSRHCNTMTEWKRLNQCKPEQKVFACSGGYPDFRDALLRRGWFQNPNKDSPHFDCKWAMVSSIDHEHLLPGQVVNHFDRCRDLTTKSGLTVALRNAAPMSDRHVDDFYPRGFDLYDPCDRADFVLDFKLTKAESIVRRFLEHVDSQAETTFSQDVVHAASKICLRIVTNVDEFIDCDELAEGLGSVAKSEWKLLEQVNLDNVLDGVDRVYTKTELEELIQKKACTTSKTSSAAARSAAEKEKEKDKKKGTKKKKKKEVEEVSISAPMASFKCPRGEFYIRQARSVLAEMEAANQQHCINGSRNAWIVKPSGKSRGRGIQMLRELEEIFRVTESEGFQWICQKYIEQPQLIHGYKFDIRQWVLVTDWNPLTFYIWKQPYVRFAGQKYDSSCEDKDPYMHLVNNSILKYMDGFDKVNEELNTQGYMWFRQQYEDWLHDNYCKCEHHHTPWKSPPPYTCESFGVNFEDVKFTAKEEDEDADDFDDNEPDDFCLGAAAPASGSAAEPVCQPCKVEGAKDGAEAAHGGDEKEATDLPACDNIWMTCVKPQIEDIILTSLRCVSDSVQHRKNTTELFGYDFMLSTGKDQPKVWLIEVNSSPACDYSTPVTCPLVKQMMEDTAKVMVDMRENPDTPTGEWELIQHAHNKFIPTRKNCPLDLQLCGQRVKRPKGWKKKKKKKKANGASATIDSAEQDEQEAGDGEEELEDEGDESAGGGGGDSESDS